MPNSPQASEINDTLLLVDYLLKKKRTLQGRGKKRPIPFLLKELGSIFGNPKTLNKLQIGNLCYELNNLVVHERLAQVVNASPKEIFDPPTFAKNYHAGGGLLLQYERKDLQNYYDEQSGSGTQGLEPNLVNDKIKISVSLDQGLIRKRDKHIFEYSLRKSTKRQRLLWTLRDGNPKPRSFLADAIYGKDGKLLSKEIKNINDAAKTKLKLSAGQEVIIHVPTGGYSLNNQMLEFEFNE